jgi:hypothetical protein
MSDEKVDSSQGCRTEIHGYVRIRVQIHVLLADHKFSTEAKDLGSLAPVKFQWPSMSSPDHCAYKKLIILRVSEAQRYRGS